MPRRALKSRKMIQALLQSGKRYRSRNLDVYYGKESDLTEDYRAAVLISTRAGNAVKRNRIRRWIREDFKQMQDSKIIPGNFIIRFRGIFSEVNHAELSRELENLHDSIKKNG